MKPGALLILLLVCLLPGCGNETKPAKSWQLVPGGITAAALGNDHALLASIDHGAEWWQLKPKKRLQHTFRHGGTQEQNLIAVAVTPDAHYALTADRQGVAWWDGWQGRPLASWALKGIQTVALSANGRWALIGLEDRAVYFSLAGGKTRFAFPHQRTVKTVALDQRQRFALTGGDGGEAKLWDLDSGRLVHRWKHRGKLAQVTLSPKGTYAMTNALLGPIRLWKTSTGELLRELDPAFITVTRAAFSARESLLATGHPSQGIKLWSVKKGRLLRQFMPDRSAWRPTARPVLGLRFIRKGRFLLSATSDGNVQMWRLSKKKP